MAVVYWAQARARGGRLDRRSAASDTGGDSGRAGADRVLCSDVERPPRGDSSHPYAANAVTAPRWLVQGISSIPIPVRPRNLLSGREAARHARGCSRIGVVCTATSTGAEVRRGTPSVLIPCRRCKCLQRDIRCRNYTQPARILPACSRWASQAVPLRWCAVTGATQPRPARPVSLPGEWHQPPASARLHDRRCHALPIDPFSVLGYVPQVCFTQVGMPPPL